MTPAASRLAGAAHLHLDGEHVDEVEVACDGRQPVAVQDILRKLAVQLLQPARRLKLSHARLDVPLQHDRVAQQCGALAEEGLQKLGDGLGGPTRLFYQHHRRLSLDRLGHSLDGSLAAGQHEQYLWDAHVGRQLPLQLSPELDLAAKSGALLVVVDEQEMGVVRVQPGLDVRVAAHLLPSRVELSAGLPRLVKPLLVHHRAVRRDADARHALAASGRVGGDGGANQGHHARVGPSRDNPGISRPRRLGQTPLEEQLQVRLQLHLLRRPGD
eukprot:scaffold20075_cov109-Isochrysis_galbana.AAC.2